MRTLLVLIGLSLATLSVVGQSKLKIDDKVKRLDKVHAGDTLHMDFSFENAGDEPLIFNGFRVSCTCTHVEFPEKPVAPGGKGILKVTFDTNGKRGWQYRDIFLDSNSKTTPDKIRFVVEVLNP